MGTKNRVEELSSHHPGPPSRSQSLKSGNCKVCDRKTKLEFNYFDNTNIIIVNFIRTANFINPSVSTATTSQASVFPRVAIKFPQWKKSCFSD